MTRQSKGDGECIAMVELLLPGTICTKESGGEGRGFKPVRYVYACVEEDGLMSGWQAGYLNILGEILVVNFLL